jgi:ATP-dependent DNA helicase RecQ
MRLPSKEYHIIGMKDLYLDYAGYFPQGREVHEAIRRCRTGDKLKTVIREEHIYLADETDTIIARLSKAAREIWLPKVDTIREINVLAMVRWGKEDISAEVYADRCKCEAWEVPVCEFVREGKLNRPLP